MNQGRVDFKFDTFLLKMHSKISYFSVSAVFGDAHLENFKTRHGKIAFLLFVRQKFYFTSLNSLALHISSILANSFGLLNTFFKQWN